MLNRQSVKLFSFVALLIGFILFAILAICFEPIKILGGWPILGIMFAIFIAGTLVLQNSFESKL